MKTNRSKGAVIIILTANAVSGAREMFLQEGFRDYLSKPIIAVQLEKMIQKYLPEELLLKNDLEKNDLGKKEEISAESVDESVDDVGTVQSENSLVEWKMGKAFCMDDEDFYMEMLQTFLDSPSATELRRFYEESDFENYHIKVHAMKSNLANIGAMTA